MKKPYTRYFYYAVIAGCFAYLLNVSWCKWGELIIDTFRDPMVALKLAQGKTLYKDVFYLFGILPPHCLAFLNKVFGINLYCSIGLGIFLTLLCCVFVYRLSRLYINRLLSSLVAVSFLGLCAFNSIDGYGALNYILPYSLATVFTVTFILASIYFFIKFIFTGKAFYLYAWGIAQYLVFLSRFDITLPVYLLFMLFGVKFFLKKRAAARALFLLLPALFAAATYAVYFIIHNNYNDFFSIIRFMLIQLTGNDTFTFQAMGMLDNLFLLAPVVEYTFPRNIALMTKSFTMQVATVAFFCFIGAWMQALESKYAARSIRKVYLRVSFAAISAFIAFLIMTGLSDYIVEFHIQYRALPLLIITGIVITFFRRTEGFERYLSFMLLASVSFVLIMRIIFRVTTAWYYGPYLVVPGMICYYVIIADIIPSWIRERARLATAPVYFSILLILFSAVLSYPLVHRSLFCYKHKVFSILSNRGDFKTLTSDSSHKYIDTLNYIKDNIPETATLVAFPEGQSINYFSGRKCPMRYDNYLPDVLDAVGEDNVLEELGSQKIDYIVIFHRQCFEQCLPYFGFDYGKKIWRWIFENYEPVKQIGVYPGRGAWYRFGALILERKKAPGRFVRQETGTHRE